MRTFEDYSKTAVAWIHRNEGRLLIGILLGYALLLFAAHGEIKVGIDNPCYTDPAINCVSGNGFTSTCWYAQGGDEFWAGNVPLHQFLLVPWLKLFGIQHQSVLWLNFIYFAAGICLLWLAMRRSGFVRTAELRLGTIGLFLITDSAYTLLTAGRYDPLALLLISAASFLLTIQTNAWRLGGLAVIGCFLPWAHLGGVLCTAILGGLLIVFYPKRLWKETLCFSLGGMLGGLLLLALYHHLGVLDSFITSIAPHVQGSVTQSGASWTRGGLHSFDLPILLILLSILCIHNLMRGRSERLHWFMVLSIIAIPCYFVFTGVFSAHYGWFLRLPLIVFIFALLSREPALGRFSFVIAVMLVTLGMAVPGSFMRKTIKNRLAISRADNPRQQIAAFAERTLKTNDVAWVAEDFYYEAKKNCLKTFSGPVVFSSELPSYPGQKADMALVTVYITTKTPWHTARVDYLPGKWLPTGEELEAWKTRFIVYRRSDLPK